MVAWLWRRLEGLARRAGPGAAASAMGSQALVYLVLVSIGTTSAQSSKPGWAINVSRFLKATPGSNVTLPCNITHPLANYQGNITTMWKRDGASFFTCYHSQTKTTCPKGGGSRYELIGDPRAGDLSLKITNVTVEDSWAYQCRIELEKKDDAYENRIRTLLLVSEEEEEEPCQCPSFTSSLDLPIGLGVLSGLLLVALLGVVGYVLWSRRGKKSPKPSGNKKVPQGPPSIPLETPSAVPIYENIPRGTNPRPKKSSV
ncbi:hypothetical protein NDU88_000418 [Pleurodeles waltl]|uniref:Ig-like domain-containing protein n=1 Tax=Pleurodeles waltl TaxID=8319 RepID=A0AAV7WHI7_PLEWA|nr:hypothetical protein NDU88_000418 [Pleurodeles waltl]